MMGFGGMGMAIPWLGGIFTVAAIWVGVWWILAAIGAAPRPSRPTHSPTSAQLPPATAWTQPPFASTPTAGVQETEPQPHPAPSESTYR